MNIVWYDRYYSRPGTYTVTRHRSRSLSPEDPLQDRPTTTDTVQLTRARQEESPVRQRRQNARSRSESPDESRARKTRKERKGEQRKYLLTKNNQPVSDDDSQTKVRKLGSRSRSGSQSHTRSSSSLSSDLSHSFSLQSLRFLPEKTPSKADLTDLIDEHPVFESPNTRRELMNIIGSLIRCGVFSAYSILHLYFVGCR